MNSGNKNRAIILNHVNRLFDVRQFMRERGLSARRTADMMQVLLQALFASSFGGPTLFTGNNRVYANGAVGAEVRCRNCRQTFWVTAIPHAFCPDCRDRCLWNE